MPGPTALGIVINFDPGRALRGAALLAGGILNVQAKLKGMRNAFKSAEGDGAGFQQRMANMRNGLNDLARGFTAVGRASLGMAKTSLDSFSELDTGFAQIDVALGFLGDAVNDTDKQLQRAKIQETVRRIGRTTEFTMRQAADAFTTLKQKGLSANEALGIIDQTLAFASASQGKINLEQAASVGFAAMNKLSLSIEETNRAFDIFTKTSSETDLSFEKFQQVFDSSSAALIKFKGTSVETFAAVSGALLNFGKSPAEAGTALNALSRSMNNMLIEFVRIERKLGRKTAKRLGLGAIGITREDLVNSEGRIKSLDKIIGVFSEKRAKALSEGRVKDIAAADAFIKTIVGTDEGLNVIEAVSKTLEKRGQTFEQFTQTLANSGNFAALAQERNLSTVKGKTALFESAIDALRVTMGELVEKAIEPYRKAITKIVNITVKWLQQNPAVANAFVKATLIFGSVTLALGGLFTVAAAVFGAFLALSPVFTKGAALLLKFGGAAGLLKAGLGFAVVAAAPLLLVVAQLIAGAVLMQLAWKNNIGGIQTFIMGWVKDLQAAFSVVGPMLSGKGVDATVWDALSTRTQNLVILMVLLRNRARNLWEGFKTGFIPVFKIAVGIYGFFISAVVRVLGVLADLGLISGKVALSTKTSAATFELLGQALGIATGAFFIYVAVMRTAKVVQIALTAATKAFQLVLKGMRVAMAAARGAMIAFNIVAAANPYVLIAGAVIALIAGMVLLVIHFKEIKTWFENLTGGAITLVDVLLFILLPISAIPLLIKKIADGTLNLFDVLAVVLLGPIGIAIVAFRHLGKVWDIVGDSIMAGINAVGQFMIKAFFFVLTVIGETILDLASIIIGAFSVAISVVIGIFIGMILVLSTVMDVIIAIVTFNWGKIPEILASAWGKAKEIFFSAMSSIRETAAEVLGGIGQTIKEAIQAAIPLVKRAFKALWEGAKEIWSSFKSWFGQQWTDFWQPIKDFGSTLFTAGVNLIKQLWAGIKAEFSKMIDKFKAKLTKLKDMFPFSPAQDGPFKTHPLDVAGSNMIKNIEVGVSTAFPGLQDTFAKGLGFLSNSLGIATGDDATAGGESFLTGAANDLLGPGSPSALQPFAPRATAAPTPAAESMSRTINVSVSIGDIKISVETFSESEAKNFVDFFVERIGDEIASDLTRRGVA